MKDFRVDMGLVHTRSITVVVGSLRASDAWMLGGLCKSA